LVEVAPALFQTLILGLKLAGHWCLTIILLGKWDLAVAYAEILQRRKRVKPDSR